ncbi:MAG TPA: 3-isopropylmalate dehydratase [Flavobacterium sp.]|nr:3-isopropylmalate dehydratase [Flavobacterium sp.]
MKVTDLNGCDLEVTDLENAIEKTGWYKEYQHIPPVESDKQRQAYWSDLHDKLLKLKEQQNEQSSR